MAVQVRCPVCASALMPDEKSWRCENGHCFDVARQGYVNLLTVTDRHSRHPGDTREQIEARRRFLDQGFYSPIAEVVAGLAAELDPQSILDAGCGEGYYLSRIGEKLPDAELCGLDISRDAVKAAAAKYKRPHWFTATAAKLPFADQSFDLILSMFALSVPEEFRRCLKTGGYYLQVIAAPDHLMGLKNVIYPQILNREKNIHPEFPGFVPVESGSIQFDFTLETNAQILDLLSMTPHFWRITKEGAARAAEAETLQDTASVIWNLYRAEGKEQHAG